MRDNRSEQSGKKQLSSNTILVILVVLFFLVNPLLGGFLLVVAGLLWYVKRLPAQSDAAPEERPAAPDDAAPVREKAPPAFRVEKPAFPPRRQFGAGTSARPPRPNRRANEAPAELHDHIRSTAPGISARLEQLETLRRAGLYTNEEYRQEKEKILRSGK